MLKCRSTYLNANAQNESYVKYANLKVQQLKEMKKCSENAAFAMLMPLAFEQKPDERMDEWMDGRTDARTHGRTDGCCGI